MKKIRYAVIGLGHIAQTAVLPAFEQTENSQLCALITGDPGKEAELSQRLRVPAYSYDDLEVAVREQGIDAVFIAVPNSLHRKFTERAAALGVHVLCEKPMAVSEEDCHAMIKVCSDANVRLMIAYRLHFASAHVRAIALGRDGGLGELRYFNSLFSTQVAPDNIRTRGDAGGGPLFDIGIYCINAARYLFRDEPVEVLSASATGNDDRFTEVEEMISVVLRFPGERLASFTCSFGASSMDQFDLVGTEASLHVEPAYTYSGEMKWTLRSGNDLKERSFPPGDQFAGELTYFSNCILHGRKPEPSGIEGLADVRIINAIFESSLLGRPVSIEPVEKRKRASEAQEIIMPPPEGPVLVSSR